MTHDFDKAYWEEHWRRGADGGAGPMAGNPPNPYLARELGALVPGDALDAGCGAGAEAIWLAAAGWRVTAADISAEALARAAGRAAAYDVADRVTWVEADLGTWQPGREFDLVTTHYAHPVMPQLELYDRLAAWVAPRGTLLVVGHGQGHGQGHGHGHRQEAPAEVAVTAASVAARFDDTMWQVVTADEPQRTLASGGQTLSDVVVRAVRRG